MQDTKIQETPFLGANKETRTLLQHGQRFNTEKQQWERYWQTGPIDGTPYFVDGNGALRHKDPQFKGSKKNRKKFTARCKLALAMDRPPATTRTAVDELDRDTKLRAMDWVLNVAALRWERTPVVNITLNELMRQYRAMIYVRAAREVGAEVGAEGVGK